MVIDFIVACDKLKQFEESYQIAEFLASKGIRGHRGSAGSCPITNWIKSETYLPDVATCQDWIVDNTKAGPRDNPVKVDTTQAIYDFIMEFDGGGYENLALDYREFLG